MFLLPRDDLAGTPSQWAAYLLSEGPEAVQESWPEVLEERPVNLLQTVFGAGVHTDV